MVEDYRIVIGCAKTTDSESGNCFVVLSFDCGGVFDEIVLYEKTLGGFLADVVGHLAFIIFASCLDIDEVDDSCSLHQQSISIIIFNKLLVVRWQLRDNLPSHE